MGHGMESTDTMFSVRIAPWHRLGTVLTDYPGRAEAMAAAGLEWTVEESPVYRKLERHAVGIDGADVVVQQTFPKLPGYKMHFRSDTGDILHVSKDSFTAIQNVVGFEVLEALLEASDGRILYETGGSIEGGKRCYVTAKATTPFVISGDDSDTVTYVVASWAHDGTGALDVRATEVRTVCRNTIEAGEAEAERTGRRFTFRHTKNVLSRVEDAKRALQGVQADEDAFRAIAEELAAIEVSDATRERFVRTFIPEPPADVISDRVRDNIDTARAQVRGLFEGVTIPDAHRNTAYGLMLAGTEYLDHLRGYRNRDTYLNRTLLRSEPLKAKLVPTIRELVAAA